jgi:methylated-DNA-[protein]-cysteine S-methyltransferase
MMIHPTPLGPLFATFERGALARLDFTPVERGQDDRRVADLLRRELDEYFAGHLRRFTVPLAPGGTPFEADVWRALGFIPFGATRSYAEIARHVGRPAASRAVGAANGKNPIAIVVPCHRVIGADGSLTGYAGGLPRKRWLLHHEARSLAAAA